MEDASPWTSLVFWRFCEKDPELHAPKAWEEIPQWFWILPKQANSASVVFIQTRETVFRCEIWTQPTKANR